MSNTAPADSHMEKLDLILAKITALEAVFAAHVQIPSPQAGGLFDFVRPPAGKFPYGLGFRMTSPDVVEAIKRACHGVNYQGTLVLNPQTLDEVWAEIALLKASDPVLVEKYRLLDPGFAGLALLTGLIDPSKYDGFIGQAKRDGWAGTTTESFLTAQLAVSGGAGIGGE